MFFRYIHVYSVYMCMPTHTNTHRHWRLYIRDNTLTFNRGVVVVVEEVHLKLLRLSVGSVVGDIIVFFDQIHSAVTS